MKRYLEKCILEDIKKKMVFIGGPRQVGKTTLVQSVAPKNHGYYNWDVAVDREMILRQQFPKDRFIIFDEIHKFSKWRNYIKGLYDKHKHEKKIIVTGSARLDYYRHSGDSLQGRYHYYRLHPLTVAELGLTQSKEIRQLLDLGGFPEPYLSQSKREAQRWAREYRKRVVEEEITALEQTQDLTNMELLLLRLPELVGSPLSVNSLREDLQVAHKTLSKWLDIFERMYLIYRLSPFSSNKLRAVKKEQKHYQYNWADVLDEGARFENLVAGHLLKWAHYQQDYEGRDIELCYFRDTDKREVDFILTEKKKPFLAVECKLKSKEISPHLKYFVKKYPHVEAVQVYLNGEKEFITSDGIQNLSWKSFLSRWV